jgi:NAD(P)H-dependent flavin oxidoreductase YrpB (nitropropane dioxygenase family)
VVPDWIKKWEKEGPPPLPMPLQNILVKDLWASSQYSGKVSQILGGTGQVMGRIDSLKPAAQIVEEMVAEATEVLQRLCAWKK